MSLPVNITILQNSQYKCTPKNILEVKNLYIIYCSYIESESLFSLLKQKINHKQENVQNIQKIYNT